MHAVAGQHEDIARPHIALRVVDAHRVVEADFGMTGEWNDLAVLLTPGASAPTVRDALDRMLDTYGTFGAYDRDRHASHRYVSEEINQNRTSAAVVQTRRTFSVASTVAAGAGEASLFVLDPGPWFTFLARAPLPPRCVATVPLDPPPARAVPRVRTIATPFRNVAEIGRAHV